MTTSRSAAEAQPLFSEAIKAEKLDTNVYRVNLRENYCIGSVPNGGYTASCMLAAAKAYLESRGLPGEALVSHFEYPSKTAAGPAVITIEDVKLGKQLSMLHVTLWQGGLLTEAPWITPSVSRRTLLAYTRHADVRNFSGPSIPTPRIARNLPLPDFDALKASGKDDNWEAPKLPKAAKFARALYNWDLYLPRNGPSAPGVLDFWMRLANGELMKQSCLAYVIDSFPYRLHGWLAAPGVGRLWQTNSTEDTNIQSPGQDEDARRANMWFPTLSLNLEAKMALPEEGVEWLTMRVISRQIKDGRFDLEVLVRDVKGEYVALGHQVAMVVSMDRNTGRRPDTKAAL